MSDGLTQAMQDFPGAKVFYHDHPETAHIISSEVSTRRYNGGVRAAWLIQTGLARIDVFKYQDELRNG